MRETTVIGIVLLVLIVWIILRSLANDPADVNWIFGIYIVYVVLLYIAWQSSCRDF